MCTLATTVLNMSRLPLRARESTAERRLREPARQRARIRTCTAPYSCSAWPRLPRRWWWPTPPRDTRAPSAQRSAERVRKTPASSARLARSESGVPALCEAASTHCALSLRWYEATNVVETSPSKKFHHCDHHREKRRRTAPSSPPPPSETATMKPRRASNHLVRVTDMGRAAGTASKLRLPGGPRRPRGLRCLHAPTFGLRSSMWLPVLAIFYSSSMLSILLLRYTSTPSVDRRKDKPPP